MFQLARRTVLGRLRRTQQGMERKAQTRAEGHATQEDNQEDEHGLPPFLNTKYVLS
jgi:hypothetical protein